MNVIDGQASFIFYSSLIFYSLTIDNILHIIVLLILAGVTISTLTGDNGLLSKANDAKESSKDGEVEEIIKLTYAEHQIQRYTGDLTEFNNTIKTKLEEKYGEGNVDVISSEDSIVIRINENEGTNFYEYNSSTGQTKKLQKGINYNGKTPLQIEVGDDITIVTEKFKVFAKDNTNRIIKVIPYYNITLTNSPVQSASAGTIAFSS